MKTKDSDVHKRALQQMDQVLIFNIVLKGDNVRNQKSAKQLYKF